jgi:crotonobetainyl-CoA:carnitine CoA-transferase CaiB-like acyl-CoA transferase
MGDEENWTRDPLYATDQSRGDHSEAILVRMKTWCAGKTTAEALAELQKAGIPAGPVYRPQQALDDPQVKAMHWLHSVTDYPGLETAAPVPDLPVQLSRSPGGIRSRPPQAGEHTDEILTALNYTPAEIAAFRAGGVV